MESKRKTRKVHKVIEATHVPKESPKPQVQTVVSKNICKHGNDISHYQCNLCFKEVFKEELKPNSPEALIRYNGELVESLYLSPVWTEIIQPLISEGIASVSGRLTNGRYYHGDFTKSDSKRDFVAGYQKALMDFNNYLNDFVLAKIKLADNKKAEEAEKTASIYNPFLEEEH